ncbi:hypothetical protein X764_30580 [Mesorhizobium sp. LSHC440A00]|nr:hypothetical protein X764_30580 [Mesorhizobium sp. LSHC440A00]
MLDVAMERLCCFFLQVQLVARTVRIHRSAGIAPIGLLAGANDQDASGIDKRHWRAQPD